jgi:hypothetical protein
MMLLVRGAALELPEEWRKVACVHVTEIVLCSGHYTGQPLRVDARRPSQP